MSSEAESVRKLEIGYVLNLDVVQYSTLLITEQTRLMAELTSLVKNTERFRRADAEGKLVRIPTGDGMALVFFDDPKAPVECAIEIATALKSHPEIRLRMGIHSGPVNAVVDVNDRANVAGAGIDMAQRVMDCGDEGHILLSKHVAEDLAPSPRWNPYLYDLGECEVKHGRKISLVNFYTDTVGNPQTPKKCAVAKTKPLLPRHRALIGAMVLLIFAVAISSLIFLRHKASRPATTVTSFASQRNAKSIAVLPFENLSHDPDNAYFADGIQEEILMRLSKIADLKVISRTSTQRYKSTPTNLLEIAKQLGAANVLEGTVQKAADQVRVNVQLINAQNDSHLWADQYDRNLTDIFAVESEIATKIADTLQAKLTSSEKQAIATRPTENSEAHQLYLKGRYFCSKRTGNDLKKSIDYFNQAIRSDPGYALAHAGLADSYALLPQYSSESPAEYFPKARAAASKALALDEALSEAHSSIGFILLYNELNFKEARREFERAIALNPNDAVAHYLLGYSVFASLSEFDSALVEFKRALELDPSSRIMNANLAGCFVLARRYHEAVVSARKAVELDPNFAYAHTMLGLALELSGDTQGAIAEYEKSLQASGSDYRVLAFLGHLYGVKGEREKASQLFQKVKEIDQSQGVQWAYGHALFAIGLGDKDQAVDWLERSYQAKETGIIIYIKVHPLLDPLLGDPRFEKLANQIVPPDVK
jgi:TolB-like protein/Flp pilus assembly protein TadD